MWAGRSETYVTPKWDRIGIGLETIPNRGELEFTRRVAQESQEANEKEEDHAKEKEKGDDKEKGEDNEKESAEMESAEVIARQNLIHHRSLSAHFSSYRPQNLVTNPQPPITKSSTTNIRDQPLRVGESFSSSSHSSPSHRY